MTEHPLIGDWRAQGRDDALERYATLAAKNEQTRKKILELYETLAAKNEQTRKKILDTLAAAIDSLDDLPGVPLSERVRVADIIRESRRVVASADVTPQPASIAAQLEEAA